MHFLPLTVLKISMSKRAFHGPPLRRLPSRCQLVGPPQHPHYPTDSFRGRTGLVPRGYRRLIGLTRPSLPPPSARTDLVQSCQSRAKDLRTIITHSIARYLRDHSSMKIFARRSFWMARTKACTRDRCKWEHRSYSQYRSNDRQRTDQTFGTRYLGTMNYNGPGRI